MDRFTEDSEPLTRTAIKPRAAGRGLPVPPVIPLVVVFAILTGLAAGYGLAQKPGPSPAPSASRADTLPLASSAQSFGPDGSAVSVVGPTAVALEAPPPAGLTLEQALDAMANAGIGAVPSAVISARVVRYSQVVSDAPNPDEWVWSLVVTGNFGGPMGRNWCPPAATGTEPASPTPCPWPATSELVVVDYQTGHFLMAAIPAPAV
jgi:hypothetical protein